ncbi:hypothetical protein T01_9164, partial [Trichinella spiralis]
MITSKAARWMSTWPTKWKKGDFKKAERGRNETHPGRDGPSWAQFYSHSVPLFIYWSLSSLFY